MKEGWTYKKLGEVARVQNGFAFDSKFFNEKGDGTPLIRIRDIKRAYSETFTTESCSDDYIIEDGNILIGMDGDFNVCSWAGGHAYLNQRVCRVISSEKLLPRFIYYLLPFPLKRINEKTSFSTVKHLSSKQVNNIIIPVPPLPEQRAIVARLDSAFAQIDALKANAERQLAEARKLFQKALEEAMTPKEGWEEKTLKEITKIIHGKNQKDVLDENGQYPIYGSGGNVMGYANDYLCEAGTTILGRKGSINNPQYINERFWNVDTAFGISAKEGNDNKFVYYFITSVDWLEKNTGTTLPSLTQQVVGNVKLFVPPLPTQHSIVAHLDALSSHVRALEEKLKKMKDECDALKQAMLREVFE